MHKGRWAVQKLRNAQRGEGVDDFVTYRYVNFEGGGGILWNSYVTADYLTWKLKKPYYISLVRHWTIKYYKIRKF